MSEGKEAKGVPQLYPAEKVEESWWNCNKMEAQEYEALKEDMKGSGPMGIDPILTIMRSLIQGQLPRLIPEKEGYLVCVDGNHRLRAARELKWKEIRVVIAEDIKDEETARAISYNKNYERGHIDPFREADNFRWLKERGWSHERIAKEYHIDGSQVSKRLSLLRVEPEVVEQVAKVTRVKSASHIEPIATLRPDLQKQVAEEIKEEAEIAYDVDKGQSLVSVREVEQIVDRVKAEDERRRGLQSAIDKSKHRECPKCKGVPTRESYKGLPFVQCGKGHTWSLKSGKLYVEPWERERAAEAAEKREAFPNYIRTTYTIEQFRMTFSNFALSVLKDLSYVGELSLDGRDKSGKTVELSLDMYEDTASMTYGGKTIEVEKKSFTEADQKDLKTEVKTFPEIRNKEKAKQTAQLIGGMMDEFGEVKTRKRRKRGKQVSEPSDPSKRGDE